MQKHCYFEWVSIVKNVLAYSRVEVFFRNDVPGLWLGIPVWISSALENSENQDRILYEKYSE